MSVAHAERLDEPRYRWPALYWFEWLLIVLGLLMLCMVLLGIAMGYSYIAMVVGLGTLGSLGYFYIASVPLTAGDAPFADGE